LVIGHTLVRRIGFRATLTLTPVIAALSFLALAVIPTLSMLIVTQVMRRAGEYGLFRPASETLFTAVGESAKYRSKSLIDTVVHRGGGALGALVHDGLTQLGLALPGLAAIGAGLCAALIGLAAWIGRKFTAFRA
ncbi:MAG: MFS transporter, partial [Steroidobacteraceae bacterium]